MDEDLVLPWNSINFHPEDAMYLIVGSGETNSDPAHINIVPYREVLALFRAFFGVDGDGEVLYYDTFCDEDEWQSGRLEISGEDFMIEVYELAAPMSASLEGVA